MGAGGGSGSTGKVPRDSGSGAHPTVQVYVPADFPEVTAFQAGRRLFDAEADDVVDLIRQGFAVQGYLADEEMHALYSLGTGPFVRWFILGWKAAELGAAW